MRKIPMFFRLPRALLPLAGALALIWPFQAHALFDDDEARKAIIELRQRVEINRQAAEAAPEHLESWLGLGWCYKRLGRLDEAIAALRSGLVATPGQPLLLYNLACYHSLAGDVSAAVDHLTKAISIDDRFRDLTGEERDFDPIRSDPRFLAATHVVV